MVRLSRTAVLVLPGDTLAAIAAAVYGNAALWPLIFAANRDRIADPHYLPAGLTLRLH